MEIIITEAQHRVILKENFKSDVIKKVESFKQYTSDVLNDLKNSMNFNFRFGVTYGAGIGVVLNHIIEHLHENYSGLSDTDIKMLAITAIMVVFFESKDTLKMENEVESKGLQNELVDAVSFTETLKTKFSKITVKEADVAYGFQEMMENIHGEVYADMLINIIPQQKEIS